MNILLINYEYPPIGGGGGVSMRDLAEELAKEHTVDVLTSNFSRLNKRERINNVNIFRVPVLRRTSLHTATMLSLLSFPFSAIISGYSLVTRKKYDIINTHFAIPSGPAGMMLSMLSKVPNVLSVIGGDIYDPTKRTSPHRHPFLRWTVRKILNNASAITAISENTKTNAQEIYRTNKNIKVIPLGLPIPSFRKITRPELGLKSERKYLISVGRLVKRKGYDYLLKALCILKDKQPLLDLLIIGDGPDSAMLLQLSKDLDISDRVLFLTSVDDERKFQYLNCSDLYVLSSIHEGFGIVLLEAMFCGLAIVATNEGGQTDIITEGLNGTLVPPADENALAGAISKILEHPETIEEIGRRNKKTVKQYSISAVAERYMDIFESVIA